MQKLTFSKRPYATLLVILVALQFILLGCLFCKTYSLNHKLNKTTAELSRAKEDSAAQARMLYNEVDYQKSLLKPVVSVKENLVIFPELKIALPYNDVTKTFQYSVGNQGDVTMGITSSLLIDHEMRQLSCNELVTVNMKDGTPLSPWQESAGSVKLPDGRTLYIIAAKAFSNNEASTVACASEVWHQITPQQVANEFKKAQTY